MRHGKSILAYIVFVLVAIGIVTQLAAGSQMLWTAVIVFGLVFLLYKFPPHRIKSILSTTSRRKRKFKVIKGNKKSGDEDPPRYH